MKNKYNYYIVILVALIITLSTKTLSYAENNGIIIENNSTNTNNENPETETETENKKTSLNIAPIIYYTPDTSMVFGGMVIFLFKITDDNSRFSILQPIFFYTLNKQIMAGLISDFYFDNDKNKISAMIFYKYFPDKFYGIGNNTGESMEEKFTQKGFISKISYQRKIWEQLRIGAGYEMQYTNITEKESGKILDTGYLIGSDKNISTGPGIIISWDNRDNSLSSTSGGLYEFTSFYFAKSLGSTSTFSRYTIDLRQFIPLYESHTLAFQFYMKILKGNVPFEYLSVIGGDKFLRGLIKGRYRDNNMMILQMEYRFIPIIWRIGMTAFICIGQVADDINNFKAKEFKIGYGFGFRLIVDKKHKINFRIDIGISEGKLYPYFIIHEAF